MPPAPMIPFPEAYFGKFLPARDPLLQHLEQEAQREKIPIVGPVVGELLYLLATLGQTRRVLELGTATGYSTLFLARACRAFGGRVLTVESAPHMAARARANFQTADLADSIELRQGDALSVLPRLNGPFDLVFMDIDKSFYQPALADCRRLLRPGGLLVADNTAFSDADGFNRAVTADSGWRALHLYAFLPGHSPEKDALTLALRV
ncbi:MAG: O-methyltransferase [Desulfobacterales bacterium]|jgi:caffeoyl-CoA O-methyltransferase